MKNLPPAILAFLGFVLIFLPDTSSELNPGPNPDPLPNPAPTDGDVVSEGLRVFRGSYASLVRRSRNMDPAQFHEEYVSLLEETFEPLASRFSALRVDEDQDGEPDGDLDAYADAIERGGLR